MVCICRHFCDVLRVAMGDIRRETVYTEVLQLGKDSEEFTRRASVSQDKGDEEFVLIIGDGKVLYIKITYYMSIHSTIYPCPLPINYSFFSLLLHALPKTLCVNVP